MMVVICIMLHVVSRIHTCISTQYKPVHMGHTPTDVTLCKLLEPGLVPFLLITEIIKPRQKHASCRRSVAVYCAAVKATSLGVSPNAALTCGNLPQS
jgi:hypothetical protein